MKQGFTLLETIIYSALFSLLIGTLVSVSYYLISTSSRTTAHIVMEKDAYFIIKKIEWILNGKVHVFSPVQGATSTELVVEKENNIFEVTYENELVKFRQKYGVWSVLNHPSHRVGYFRVMYDPNHAQTGSITVEFTLNGKYFTHTFYLFP